MWWDLNLFKSILNFLEGDWVQSFRATERPRHPLQQIALTENFVRGPLYVTQTDRITKLHLKVMLAKSTSEIQSQMGHRQSLVPIIWKSDFFFKSTSGFHISSRETTKLASLYTGQNIQITKHLYSGGIPGLKKHVIKFQISLILDNVAYRPLYYFTSYNGKR